MNKISKYILLGSLVAFTLTACSEEETWQPGEQVPENCQGVYFVSSTSGTTYILDPDDAKDLEFSVSRTKTEDAITVPLTVLTNDSNIFVAPESVSFEAGQDTATFTVSFPNVQSGITYHFEIGITDTQYGNTYGQEPIYLAFSVLVEKWNSLGMATYREDFITTFFQLENLAYEVEILENDLIPGLYRLVNPYGEAYPYNEPGDWDDSQDWYLEIHAEDPDGVYIETQYTGMDWGYGNIIISSMAGYYIEDGSATVEEMKEAGYCGTLADGIITFPTQALLVCMPEYSSSLYYANTNGMFAVALPGYTLPDASGVAAPTIKSEVGTMLQKVEPWRAPCRLTTVRK